MYRDGQVPGLSFQAVFLLILAVAGIGVVSTEVRGSGAAAGEQQENLSSNISGIGDKPDAAACEDECVWVSQTCGGGECADDKRLETLECNNIQCDQHGDVRCAQDQQCQQLQEAEWVDQTCGDGTTCDPNEMLQEVVCESGSSCDREGETRCQPAPTKCFEPMDVVVVPVHWEDDDLEEVEQDIRASIFGHDGEDGWIDRGPFKDVSNAEQRLRLHVIPPDEVAPGDAAGTESGEYDRWGCGDIIGTGTTELQESGRTFNGEPLADVADVMVALTEEYYSSDTLSYTFEFNGVERTVDTGIRYNTELAGCAVRNVQTSPHGFGTLTVPSRKSERLEFSFRGVDLFSFQLRDRDGTFHHEMGHALGNCHNLGNAQKEPGEFEQKISKVLEHLGISDPITGIGQCDMSAMPGYTSLDEREDGGCRNDYENRGPNSIMNYCNPAEVYGEDEMQVMKEAARNHDWIP